MAETVQMELLETQALANLVEKRLPLPGLLPHLGAQLFQEVTQQATGRFPGGGVAQIEPVRGRELFLGVQRQVQTLQRPMIRIEQAMAEQGGFLQTVATGGGTRSEERRVGKER